MFLKEFIKNIDYEVFEQKVDNLKGGRPTTEYTLTVDTAKNVCMDNFIQWDCKGGVKHLTPKSTPS